MTLKKTLAQLEALGNEKMRAQNTKHGAGDKQYGVRLGDIRKPGGASGEVPCSPSHTCPPSIELSLDSRARPSIGA